MGLFDTMFGSGTKTAETSDAPETQSETKANQPEQPNQPPQPTGLDRFSELFSKEVKEEGFDPSKLFSTDQKAFDEQVGQMNFVKDLATEEDLSAIAEGGDKAVSALMRIVNGVGQQVYKNSALTAMGLNQESLKRALPEVDKRFTSLLTNQRTQEEISKSNPALAHPVGQYFAGEFAKRLRSQFPEATPEQIKEKTLELFNDFTSTYNPDKSKETEGKEAFDWDAFISADASN